MRAIPPVVKTTGISSTISMNLLPSLFVSGILFFIKEDAPVRPTYPEAKGLRHLAFRVDSVEETVKELTAKGIECEPIRNDTFNGKAMTFFYDPAGTPLEIHE